MKLLGLDLLRWGPFSDLALDFSAPARALHIVVGSNEAGKSTTLRGVMGLFFGIPDRTADDHRHPKPDLRIGGRVASEDGKLLTFVRKKGRKNTLLDGAGEAADEETLRLLLGKIEREQFETMFGLSHDRLVEGGRALVEGRGDLGESLFGAGLGQTGLSALLRRLDSRAEDIFVPRGRTKKLNHVIDKWKAAKKQQQDLSQSVRAWEEHKKDLDAQRERTALLVAELESLSREHRRLGRIKRARRPIAERAEILAALVARKDVVLLPDTAAEERRAAEKILRDAGPREEQLVEDVRRLETKLGALLVPASLLERGSVIRKIQEGLGSHRKASVDATRLRGELRQLEDEVRVLSAKLGRDVASVTAESALLPAALDTRVKQLIKRRVALDADVRGAEQARLAAEDRLAHEKRRGSLLADPVDVSALGRALELARREGDLDKRIRERAREADELRQRVSAKRAALSLYDVPFEKIGSLPLPSRETIERFEKLVRAKDEELRQSDRVLAEKRKALSTKQQELRVERRDGEVPTFADITSARAARDAAWVGLRGLLLEGPRPPVVDTSGASVGLSPRTNIEAMIAFDALIKRVDELYERRFNEAKRVESAARLMREIELLERELEELSIERAQRFEGHEALAAEWAQAWVSSGVKPLPPSEMKDFLSQYERLAEDVVRWRESETLLSADRTRAAEHADALVLLLPSESAGSEGLAALIERARAVCEREERVRAERATHKRELEQRLLEVAQATAVCERQKTEHGVWLEAWGRAMAEMFMPPPTIPAEAENVLVLHAELSARCQDAEERRRRIAGIERDAQKFAASVTEVVRIAAQDLEGAPAEEAAGALADRFLGAEKDDVERRNVATQLEEKRRELAEALLRRKSAERDLEALVQAARVLSPADLPAAEECSREVRELRGNLAPIERQLLDLGEGLSLEALVAENQDFPGDDVTDKLRAVEEKIAAVNDEKARIEQEKGKLEERLAALDGSGRAAEAAEDAENHLAQMGTLVEEYCRARLAYRLLEDEIKQYREKHQGPIVRRASELFEKLTLGSFLAIRGDDEGEEGRPILKCVRPSGSLVGVEGLSDGTRDQLFLALRIASLERHFEHNEPIPFVLDDILVNFDDARSRASLSILGELSARTQVLFFTHHARVAELAREVLSPERLCVHDLDVLGGKARALKAS